MSFKQQDQDADPPLYSFNHGPYCGSSVYFYKINNLRRSTLNRAGDNWDVKLRVIDESKDGKKKNYLDPTNPTDGRPGLRSSTGTKGKSKVTNRIPRIRKAHLHQKRGT